jgi:hypothetical protein
MAATVSARTAILVAALAAAALVVVLALSPAAGAHARGAACTHPAARHSDRDTHSCAGVEGTDRSGHRSKLHDREKSGRHRTKHRPKRTASAEGGEGAEEASEGGEEGVEVLGSERQPGGAPEALCEDGSAPEAEGSGAFACEDGSEPACAGGLRPVVSADGSQLLCEAASGDRRSD